MDQFALAPQLLNTVMMTDNGAQDMLEVRNCGETRTRMRHPAWMFSIAKVAQRTVRHQPADDSIDEED